MPEPGDFRLETQVASLLRTAKAVKLGLIDPISIPEESTTAIPGINTTWEERRNAREEKKTRSAETEKDVLASLQSADTELGEVYQSGGQNIA